MKTHKKLLFAYVVVILFAIGINPIAAPAASKRYSIDQVKIEAEILPDGSLFIKENRSYTFRGTFHWADYSLPLKNLGRITDFELGENEIMYRQGSGEDPGTYQYSQSEEKFYVKWFYRARNESRTFTLKYRVEDAVTVYSDVAELYYKLVSERNEKPISAVEVVVKFPYEAHTSQVGAWAHGPLHGQLAFKNGNIYLWVSPLPKRNWWEVRAIFPPEWIPAAQRRSDEFRREQIMSEERLLVEQSNAQRLKLLKKREFQERHRNSAFQLSVILAIIGLAGLIVLYNRYGKAHEIPVQGRISSEIPQDVSPALANYVYFSGQIGAGAIVSTMLDLARRGFLKIEEMVQEKKSIFGTSHKLKYTVKLVPEAFEQNKNELAVYEQDLIQFIFQNLAQGSNEIGLDKIKDSSRQVIKWFGKWKEIIKDAWGRRPFYDRSSIKGTVISAIVSILIIASGVVILIFLGFPGAFAMIAGVILLGLSFIILRYTKEIKLLRAKLAGLKQYLSKYHFRRDAGNLSSAMERFLIFGVALGISSKVMKELLSLVPEWQSGSYFAWYAGSMGHGSPASFAKAVTSMVSAASTTMGSAAGVGGGASAGGGAGAGGASGGAG